MGQNLRLLVVGAGNMGGALARGLSHKDTLFRVTVTDLHPGKAEALAAEPHGEPVRVMGHLEDTLRETDIIALCVKPQDLGGVAARLKGHLRTNQLVISILAGVTLDDVAAELAFTGGIVRAMPNIAATSGAAATGMAANAAVSAEQMRLAEAVFSGIGKAEWLKESLLDAVTGLSGSGPAYVYMVIEALTDGGVKMGIPRAVAARLAAQTVYGAAKLVIESGLHPAILRDQVTTPGGTTINAIHELEDRGLRAMLISAVETATQRAAFLRKKH